MSHINGLIGGTRIPTGTTASCSGIHTLSQHGEWVSRSIWEYPAPKRVSGLQLWLDASDSNTLYDATSGGSLVASNGAVARWEDKSGNARHATQSTLGSRPLRKTNQLNSLDGLDFDGTDDSLRVDSLATYFAGSNKVLTVFAVAQTDVTGSAQDMFSGARTSSNDGNYRFVWNNGSQKLQIAREDDTSSGVSLSAGTSLGTTAHVAVWCFDGTNGSIFLDGTSDVTASNLTRSTITVNSVAIGNLPRLSPAVFFNGRIYEIAVYNTAVSTGDRNSVESYLKAKWGTP